MTRHPRALPLTTYRFKNYDCPGLSKGNVIRCISPEDGFVCPKFCFWLKTDPQVVNGELAKYSLSQPTSTSGAFNMHLRFLLIRLNFPTLITCLFLLQLAIAGLPGASTDLLIPKSGPARLRDQDVISLSSSRSFQPSLITCTYHGIWGCPIWRVRVTMPPPNLGLDSLAGSTLDLPLRPVGSDPNDTAPNQLHRAWTAPESSYFDTPASRFQSLLRETCGSSTDGDSNVSEFRAENRDDGSTRVEFRLAYARILEDIIQPAKSCVEDALERMVGGGEGMRVECRMPGARQDHGPPQHDWT